MLTGDVFLRKKIEFLMVVIILCGTIAASQKLSQYVVNTQVRHEEQEKTIVLDPGHGVY